MAMAYKQTGGGDGRVVGSCLARVAWAAAYIAAPPYGRLGFDRGLGLDRNLQGDANREEPSGRLC